MTTEIRTDSLRPMTNLQIQQTREFVTSLDEVCQTYWDMVNVGDVLSRELHITPELVILYADAVEDYNPWYEGWRMNTWYIPGESPFGGAIVPPLMVSHFVLSVQVSILSHLHEDLREHTVCDCQPNVPQQPGPV